MVIFSSSLSLMDGLLSVSGSIAAKWRLPRKRRLFLALLNCCIVCRTRVSLCNTVFCAKCSAGAVSSVRFHLEGHIYVFNIYFGHVEWLF